VAALQTSSDKVESDRAHDLTITLPEISWTLYKEVSRLAPFGAENPKPIFLLSNIAIASVKKFGKEQNHVEVTLSSEWGQRVRAFDFFKTPESFSHTPESGKSAHVMATLERDSFRGPAKLALRIIDILPA